MLRVANKLPVFFEESHFATVFFVAVTLAGFSGVSLGILRMIYGLASGTGRDLFWGIMLWLSGSFLTVFGFIHVLERVVE
jgi:hypothetical protein